MNAGESLLLRATAQQDYAWFLAAMGWITAAVLAFSTRRSDARRSTALTGVALAGLAQAAIELAWHALPPAAEHRYDPRDGWDLALALALAAGVGATAALAAYRRAWWPLGVAGMLGLSLAARHLHYGVGSAGLALIGMVVTWVVLRGGLSMPGERTPVVLLLIGLLPLVATIGPLAGWTTDHHRTSELSRWALPSAAMHLAAAVALSFSLWQSRWRDAEGLPPAASLRWFLVGLGSWLGLGLGLVLLMGWFERRSFERQLLARVSTSAEWLDKNAVAACLAPDFRVEKIVAVPQPSGRTHRGAHLPFLAAGVAAPLRQQLTRVERTSPDALWAHVVTIRSGWLVSFAFAERIPGVDDFAPLLRRAGEEDRADWVARRAVFDAPALGTWGETVRARAPLVDEHGQMLGWLALEFGVVDWAAAQARARLLTFAIVGLGGALMLLGLLRSWTKRSQREALALARAAESADQAKTAFLARVSHELRTPIQSVLGYTDLIGRTPPGPLFAQRQAALREHAELMLRLVNDLIDLSAAQAGAFRLRPAPLAFAPLVWENIESLRPRAEAKGLALSCRVEPGLPRWVLGDAMRLRQLVNNLVGNALKYTVRGGVEVVLSGNGIGGTAPVVCRLVVRDTGPGIAPAEQERIFQPFTRLAATAEADGVGLGLALSRALATSMGGSLRVESDGRTGSAFIAELTLLQSPAPEIAAETGLPPAPRSLAGRTILVAEDNNLVRELFVAYLTELGAACSAVSDGVTALERLERERFDGVVLDLSMPRLGGLEVARELRAGGRTNLRIVGVSAHADLRERDRACAAGMDEFLIKPVELCALAAALDRRQPAAHAADQLEREALVRRLGLVERFAQETQPLLDELTRATGAAEWDTVAARAHYLKNSADVLQLAALAEACQQLEQAARRDSVSAALEALDQVQRLVREWRPLSSL